MPARLVSHCRRNRVRTEASKRTAAILAIRDHGRNALEHLDIAIHAARNLVQVPGGGFDLLRVESLGTMAVVIVGAQPGDQAPTREQTGHQPVGTPQGR